MVQITSARVDDFLSNVSLAYTQDQMDFIAVKVFPVVPVSNRSDKYRVWPQNEWLRDDAQPRGRGTESEGSTFTLSEDNYSVTRYAFHHDLTDEDLADQPDDINLEAAAARIVSRKILIRMENQWVTDFYGTGKWTNDATPAVLWSDPSSNPISDIEDYRDLIFGLTGMNPNTLVVSRSVWRQLKSHPDFIDRIKYTSADAISQEIVARYLEIDRLLVWSGRVATNNEGETAAYSNLSAKSALLTYVAPNAAPEVPTAGYTFSWTGAPGNSFGATVPTSRFEIPERKVLRIESDAWWDNKIVAPDLGVFINGAVA